MVVAVLASTSPVPAPLDVVEHAICALGARPLVDDEAALVQTWESLSRNALATIADRVAFESCVASMKVPWMRLPFLWVLRSPYQCFLVHTSEQAHV